MIPPRNLARTLLLTPALVAIGAYWYFLLDSHRQIREATLARTETVAQQLANGLAAQMASVVRNIDFVSDILRQDYVSDKSAFAVSVQGAFRAFPEHTLLQVAVIDRNGYLAYSSLGMQEKVFLGDREHFRIHAEHPDTDRAFFGKPLLGRVSGSWSIQFSRPVRRDGAFDGVLVLSISPEYLSHALEQLGLGEHDSAALIREDGSYLATNRDIDFFIGETVKGSPPYLAPDAPARGSFRDGATHAPLGRISAWRHLKDSDQLMVHVGIAEQDVLAPVEDEAAASRKANLAGTLLFLFLLAVIMRQWRRLEHQHMRLQRNEKLYRSFFEKHSSIKLLVDPRDGSIRFANDAAAAFYGYARSTLESMRITDLNSLPADEVRASIGEATSKRSNRFVFKHRLAGGALRDVEVYSCPLEMDGTTLLYSIIHDITERQQLEIRLKDSEERYRRVFATVPSGMMLLDGEGDIVLWNDAALTILGVDAAGLQRRAVKLFKRDGQPVAIEDYPSRRALREPAAHALYYAELENGGKRWISVHTSQLPPDAQGRSGAVVSYTDVSKLIELEESLLISQSVFESTTEAIVVADADSRVIRVNPAFTRMTGYDAEEVIGKRPVVLSSGQQDEAFWQAMCQSLNAKGSWEGEITDRHKNGQLFIEKLKISALTHPDGIHSRYVALCSDITSQKEQEAQVWHRAHHDALTGLPNRNLFLDRLGQAITRAQRRRESVGLLFIDLDRFKPVNDTWGHQAGDLLLCQVAARIGTGLRDEDTLARIGGDEFVVLLPQVASMDGCRNVAAKILANLETPFELGMATLSISASIGIAISHEGDCSAEALLHSADVLMYKAKQERNSFASA
ncbi:sensor domain-containing diguanylate cyclase [Thauera linaloolentis]|uniref:Diguanylate cyclase with PAS sensor(S) n=1 Tax=Thauera linaloolentis (strain DSM 12138 / JCM 21573 / CCUG 41526 / CIP 105981 / IAM 15112 / NBRC 102519 / 47Lol) TaxID=1123367 RepID=N6XYX5_THAL4|nr:PAS domain S-box protein [Thauera linaloolentis]ENO84440.1 diguanylate cyclase with PAS sensor(s) [Thauera linaloolentis 47Lol = DSM 12138]MCM8567495.1 PAS domain S-box protein [Thauera linaloolentis]